MFTTFDPRLLQGESQTGERELDGIDWPKDFLLCNVQAVMKLVCPEANVKFLSNNTVRNPGWGNKIPLEYVLVCNGEPNFSAEMFSVHGVEHHFVQHPIASMQMVGKGAAAMISGWSVIAEMVRMFLRRTTLLPTQTLPISSLAAHGVSPMAVQETMSMVWTHSEALGHQGVQRTRYSDQVAISAYVFTKVYEKFNRKQLVTPADIATWVRFPF